MKLKPKQSGLYAECGMGLDEGARALCGKRIERFIMWLPSERFFILFHIAGSVATLFCCASLFVICLAPSSFPAVYRLLVDDRVGIVIPYLLFIALGEALFSLWYFIFRK